MYFVTGDIHGNAYDLKTRCAENGLTENDTIIVVGDVAANYFLDDKDKDTKKVLQKLKPTVFCIQGNHEARPENIPTYKTKEWNGGLVFYEDEFPNILFGIDGEVYNFDGKSVLVCGGAYSVDKYYRAWHSTLYHPSMVSPQMQRWICQLANGNYILEKDAVDRILNELPSTTIHWWKDEQMNENAQKKCLKALEDNNWKIDVILSHTCPLKYEPTEMFLNGVNQDLVDKTTEKFLDKIEDRANYQ